MGSSARIGGITFGYDDAGSGDPLVLVHGHPFDRSMWGPQTARFSHSGWRVIAPDLRGYGASEVVPGKTRLGDFARDISGLLDHLGVGEIVLCGLSMGGQIALEFHRLFPGRLRALVLADTSAPAESEDGRRARHEAAQRLLDEGMGPYTEEVLPKMVAPHNIRALPDVAAHVRTMMRATSPEGAAAALRGRAERPDYVPVLAGITVPTLVVVGSDDEFTPLSDARLLHERIPGAALAVVDGAAHMPNLERAEVFDERLDAFLSGLQPRTEEAG